MTIHNNSANVLKNKVFAFVGRWGKDKRKQKRQAKNCGNPATSKIKSAQVKQKCLWIVYESL